MKKTYSVMRPESLNIGNFKPPNDELNDSPQSLNEPAMKKMKTHFYRNKNSPMKFENISDMNEIRNRPSMVSRASKLKGLGRVIHTEG
jgi:hypothetical protein